MSIQPPFNLPIQKDVYSEALHDTVPFKKTETTWESPSGETYEITWVKDNSLNIFDRIIRVIGIPFGVIAQVIFHSKIVHRWLVEAKNGSHVHLAYVLKSHLNLSSLNSEMRKTFFLSLEEKLGENNCKQLNAFFRDVVPSSLIYYKLKNDSQEQVTYELTFDKAYSKNGKNIPKQLTIELKKINDGILVTFPNEKISFDRFIVDKERKEIVKCEIVSLKIDENRFDIEMNHLNGAILLKYYKQYINDQFKLNVLGFRRR